MPFRPLPENRRNIHNVIYPLTVAIQGVYGNRAQDGGRPIGAFYPVHVGTKSWYHLGGIWYRPHDEQKVLSRSVDEQVVAAFAESILTGTPVELPKGTVVRWESIPAEETRQLPPPL